MKGALLAPNVGLLYCVPLGTVWNDLLVRNDLLVWNGLP